MKTHVKEPLEALLEGFYDVIPKDKVSIFTADELELLMSGKPDFDVDDMKKNVTYEGGFTAASPQIKWLFEILREFNPSQRGKFLFFATGSTRVPANGF